MTSKKDAVTAAPGGVDLKESDVTEAKREGALDYVREGSKGAMAADTGTTGDVKAAAEAERLRVAPDANTTFIAPLLDLSIETLVQRMTNDKVPDPISFDDAKALLALERAGRNRTNYVQALCKRLGVDSPYEVTHAGPPYTNDATSVTVIER